MRTEAAARPSVFTPTIDTIKVEQAKGVLMLRYGINSHEAYAVLLRWAHEAGTDTGRIAHVLLHAICQNDPVTEQQESHLVRWLTSQLRTLP
ncbi:ANTAR domain-containing protein [Nocardioides pacificus]